MHVKAGAFVLLILCGVIAVQGEWGVDKRGTCQWPDGTCYYAEDDCPDGFERCNLTCDVSTNLCCCPKGDPCWPPDGNCYYINDPCPKGTSDCGLPCPVPTNKCCCND